MPKWSPLSAVPGVPVVFWLMVTRLVEDTPEAEP